MTLSPGSRLGPYEILSPLGAGGMGEVYKAKDTRLDRFVAVKVLPEQLAQDADALARFEREAKAVAALNHPNILGLFDIGRADDTAYAVMELLEGESLRERLRAGALPAKKAVELAVQMAHGLAAAHEKGIVHRDLKPENLWLTKEGRLKILDFGLAKQMLGRGFDSEASTEAFSPGQHTGQGTILGTVGYMSPEQVKGQPTDPRSDIFSFGVVLYEMLGGARPFKGNSAVEVMHAILRDDPPELRLPQGQLGPGLERVVKTCLAKDPDDRWHSARDLARELRWVSEAPQPGAAGASPPLGRSVPWGIAALAVALAAAAVIHSSRRTPSARDRAQFSIVPPEPTVLSDFLALSPDGKTLAFAGISGGKSLVRIRELASDDVRALAGTDSPETLFWSPDGRSLGFVSRGKLRRIDLASGGIETLCDADLGRGGSWASRGEILFSRKSAGAIYRVAAAGGEPVAATRLQPGDLVHRWPQFLPDGRRFLYFAKTSRRETTGTYLASLDAPGRRLLLRNGATGVFLPPDTLLFGRGEALLAQRVDMDRAALEGAPEPVTRPVMRAELASFEDLFTVSDSGIVVFRPGSAERRLTWVDRRGNLLKTLGAPGLVLGVSLSPDGREAGVTFRSVETGLPSISILDVDRDVATPFADPTSLPTASGSPTARTSPGSPRSSSSDSR